MHSARRRRRLLPLAAAILGAAVLAGCASAAGGTRTGEPTTGKNVLVVGMTASDIPFLDTGLSQNQGYEGVRFVGNQLYDGLTRFNLGQSDHIPEIVPSLAVSWQANPTKNSWTFKLRPNVKFHDGTPFNADAVVFNIDRYAVKGSPEYYPELNAQAGLAISGIKGAKKIDDLTVEIDTDSPMAYLPANLTTVFMGSPTAIKKKGNAGFGKAPVGTGPFIFVKEAQGQSLTMRANPNYWGGRPKVDEVILRPVPDATARVSALESGEVNWIEVPPPDAISELRSKGYRVLTNSYDHVWPWVLDTSKAPFDKLKVRQALNYAIDRDSLIKNVLAGTADPELQVAARANAAYRATNNLYRYDPAKAKRLLAEAGYPHGFTFRLSYPTSGSGNMVPTPMNQALQQDLAKVGVKVKLEPVEWASMLTDFFAGKIPGGADAINISLSMQQEGFWDTWFGRDSIINVGRYTNARVDALLRRAKATFDDKARYALYAQAAGLITRDAAWLFVVDDRNPRVLAPNVKGFVQAKSWFADLTTLTVS